MPPLAMPKSRVRTSVCPKCGTTEKSGKRSCCARGAAWFNNCGDGGDLKYDHTWAEGIHACESRLGRESLHLKILLDELVFLILVAHAILAVAVMAETAGVVTLISPGTPFDMKTTSVSRLPMPLVVGTGTFAWVLG